MLKITDYFQTKDVEANKIISSFISNRLLEMMGNIQDDTLSDYFPAKYPAKKQKPVIQDLSNLLKASKPYSPALIMEYILFQLINSKTEYCVDNETSTIARLPAPDWEYLLGIYKKEYDTYEEAHDEDAKEIAYEVFEKLIHEGMPPEKAQAIVNITDEQLEIFLQSLKKSI